ncbi:serine hydrolase domain-containing protein [Thaumasiovibrio sp. DFM-14]|uniref:serine hydrolase domain-containing protein n=1 Tax=Thaumasiovibrio sp. DFM-14 TaxID=3384792 RepID=UPI0039A22909
MLLTRLCLSVALFFGYFSYVSASDASLEINSQQGADFAVGEPQTVAVNPVPLQAMDSFLSTSQHRLHSVLVIKDQTLIYERYFSDTDAMVGYEEYQAIDFAIDTPNLLFSSTKSVMSILAGAAVQQGFISELDTPITQLLPEEQHLMQGEQRDITLRHALNMGVGIDFNEWKPGENGASRLEAGHPWYDFSQVTEAQRLEYIFSRDMACSPGKCFQYSGAAVELTAKSIEAASQQPIAAFAEQYLFSPLGITAHDWLQREGGGTAYDWGLSLTSRDFAKLGQLYLNQGQWQGEQIVPKQWIEDSYLPAYRNISSGLNYSRYWYHPHFRVKPDSIWTKLTARSEWIPVLMSQGYGNQMIFIFPEQNLLVVLTAGEWLHHRNLRWHKPSTIARIMAAPYDLVANYILPAVLDADVEFVPNPRK